MVRARGGRVNAVVGDNHRQICLPHPLLDFRDSAVKFFQGVGIAAGIVPFFFCFKVKSWFGYDDALDTFGVHAVGGTLGAFLTGILARNAANANLATNLKDYVTDSAFQPLAFEQLKAIALTLCLAVVGTTVIAFAVKAVLGLRPNEDVELARLDVAEHGEEGYHTEGFASARSGLISGELAPAPVNISVGNRKAAAT